jgi:hypothetical protein
MSKKKVTKKLKSVPAVAPAVGGDLPKTGNDLVGEALARMEESLAKFELGVGLLNDAGKDYWAKVENEAAKKAIQDYVQKAAFALTSLRDEVGGVLSAPPAARKLELPTLEMPVAQIPMAAIFKDQPTKTDLAQARDTVGMAFVKLSDVDIPMREAEGGLRVLTFLGELHKNLKAMAEKAQAAA